MASDGLEPIKYGDLVCLGSQVTLDQTTDVLLQSQSAHQRTGNLCADGLVSQRCTFRLEDPLNVGLSDGLTPTRHPNSGGLKVLYPVLTGSVSVSVSEKKWGEVLPGFGFGV